MNYLSTAELAKRLGISRITVFNWIKSGKLKAERIGRGYVIDVSDAEKFTKAGASDESKQKEIGEAVTRVVKEYGETLKKLGAE